MIKNLLLSLLLAAGATNASAQEYKYFTFQQQEGQMQSLSIENLKIVFDNGKLVATNNLESISIPLANMQTMYFNTEATGIENASTGHRLDVRIADGKLRTNAPEGSSIRVFSPDGKLIPASANLSKGIYLVRINDRTYKVSAQ